MHCDVSFRQLQALGLLAAIMIIPTPAHAGDVTAGIVAESVINFGCGGCCVNCPPPASCVNSAGFADLCNSNANAAGFYEILESTSWTTSGYGPWTDANVYDQDFVDPDLGWAYGNDTHQFDDALGSGGGTAIAFFAGHGWTGSHRSGCEGNTQQCTHATQCTNPLGVEYTPPAGTCVSSPKWGVGHGQCCYATEHALQVNGGVVSFNNTINYDSGYVAWGESGYSGAWGGAGTNGQDNLVVINASWPSTQNYGWNNLVIGAVGPPTLAGARLIATVMPTDGDYDDIADRGSAFATYSITNPTYAVFDAWTDAINDLDGGAPGDNCPGGYGFNGCGCHYVIATGVSESQALEHSNEVWLDLQNDANDTTGNVWEVWGKNCNYNLETYPSNLP
jgi:hypothetical protein